MEQKYVLGETESAREHEQERCLICDKANRTDQLPHGVCSVCEAEAETLLMEVRAQQ